MSSLIRQRAVSDKKPLQMYNWQLPWCILTDSIENPRDFLGLLLRCEKFHFNFFPLCSHSWTEIRVYGKSLKLKTVNFPPSVCIS